MKTRSPIPMTVRISQEAGRVRYTPDEIKDSLDNKTAILHMLNNGTILILDTTRNDKIMGELEQIEK